MKKMFSPADSSLGDESAFSAEIIVGSIVAVAIVAAVLVMVYLKRK